MTKPVILSASRSTDIPAFYLDWFFNRLNQGWCSWINPFNNIKSEISFEDTKFIVFWSKNPLPLLYYLPQLENKGIGCYIQFTLNFYDGFNLENVPMVNTRIETFKRLVETLGLGSVIWRFDPLILTTSITQEILLERIRYVGENLKGYTEKLVFSFADISSYFRVKRNLDKEGLKYIEWTSEMMLEMGEAIKDLRLPMELATCGEKIEIPGIMHNKCIDPVLIKRLKPELSEYIDGGAGRKDKGQRLECGCMKSKDIGQYNTCLHLCKYCYANTNEDTVKENWTKHTENPFKDTIY
jgi:hypothetical protein